MGDTRTTRQQSRTRLLTMALCSLATVAAALVPTQGLAQHDSGGVLGGPQRPAVQPPTFPAPMTMPPSASVALPATQAAPSTTPSPSRHAASPAHTPESWTSFSHGVPQPDGTMKTTVSLVPMFRSTGNGGSWKAVDATVSTHDAAHPFSAEGAVRPIRFGRSASDVADLALDRGDIRIAAPGLAIAEPTKVGNGVKYSGVATDTDLYYQVTTAGLFEQIVLNSSAAPNSFTFHISDPPGQLGALQSTADGGYTFDPRIDGDVALKLEPANAYVASVAAEGGPVFTAGSAHQTLTRAGDGYDITESVDPTWLQGKSFPIVLDPTVTLDNDTGNASYALATFDNSGGGCGSGCASVDGGYDLGVGWYAPYLYRESYFQYNVNNAGIPSGSEVSGATFQPSVIACWIGGTNPCQPSSTFAIGITPMTGSWSAGQSWASLKSLRDSYNGGPAYGNYVAAGNQNSFTDPYPSYFDWSLGLPSWLVQGWLDNGWYGSGFSDATANNGFGAYVYNSSPCAMNSGVCGGPVWENDTPGTCPNNCIPQPSGSHSPELLVDYTPPPTENAPSASAGPGQATVSWSTATTGWTVDHYQLQTYTSSGTLVSSTRVNGTSTTVSGLTDGSSYYFNVYAVDGGGRAGPSSANSNTVTPKGIQLTKSVVQTSPYSAASPQPFFSRGETVTYQLTVTNPMPDASSTVSSLTDQLPAGLAGVAGSLLLNGTACSICALSGNQFSLTSPLTLAAGAGDVFTYTATALGTSDRLCSVVTNAASVVASFGAAANATAPITICDSALGYENWWTYVNQDLGAGGRASVNVANGNLVVQVTDSTPVQAHGRFAYALRRTYNSQDTANLVSVLPSPGALPDAVPIGTGWRLNVDELGDGIVDGAVADGLLVSSVTGLATAAFDVTLVDEDGTHHVFTPNGLAANGIPILGSGITPVADLLDLVPRALLRLTTNDNVCVDETFNSPAGVHLSLWRYLEVNPTSSSQPCTPANGTTPVVMGFAAMRPDRLRLEFSANGQLLDETDGAGVELRYLYLNQPVPAVALGNLLAVYEPRSSCTPTIDTQHDKASVPLGCRALVFDYSQAMETDVTDPGGRTTQYLRNSSDQLIEVKNKQAGTAYQYTYSTPSANCGSSYGQLCSASDLNLAESNTTSPCPTVSSPQHISCFAYSAPGSGLGLPQLTTLTDRRGYSTTFTYAHASTVSACGTTSSDYVTADRAGERQRFECIDSAGSVGEIDQGSTTDTYQHQTLNFWDTGGQGTCTQPTAMTDHNLCRSFRYTLAGAQTAEDTSYTFNPEGQELIKSQCFQASDPGANGTPNQYPPEACPTTKIATTAGYQAEYTMGDGTQPAPVADTVAGNGTVTSGARPTGHAGTLYVLSDKTQSLTPDGNASGSNIIYFTTSYVVDNNQAAAPNAVVTATECAPAITVNGVPCATNPAASGTIQSSICPGTSSNTGLVCETDAPGRTTRYEYDSFGAKVAMVTPNASATSQSRGNAAPPGYLYVYYSDSQLDLSGSVSAGGWLLATVDPTGNFAADAYDEAGNLTRVWDRNATQSYTFAQFPGTASSPPSAQYAETLHGNGSAPYSSPWRSVLSQRDPLGFVSAFSVDGDGNQVTIRPQNGTVANSSAYDITQRFDTADELTSHLMPQETSGNHATVYTYDAFGNKATMTSPNGVLTAYAYDSVNRLTTTQWTRAVWPSDTTTVPTACRESTVGDAPIPAGLILCFTRASYDGVDNMTSSSDGNAQVTSYVFDSLHRTWQTVGPRQVNGGGTVTANALDADGNVIWSCSPREFTDPGHTNCAPGAGVAPYSTRRYYTALDQAFQMTTFRIVGGATQSDTTSYAYDADGNQISSTDPNGHTTTTQYDLLDRKVLQTTPRDAVSSNVTQWFYDPAGNVITLDQPDGPSTGSGADGALVVDGSSNGASNPYVIPAGKNYTNVTLQNGAAVTVAPYDGNADGSGIVQITATGTVSICQGCSITVAGRGPAGGTGGAACHVTCTPSSTGSAGLGMGGGAGGASATLEGGPGGGGGHAAAGQQGVVPPYNASTASLIAGPAAGGHTYGSANMAASDVSVSGMGSGGGGGGGCNCPAGANGGAGGGLVGIVANAISVSGSIDASGGTGQSTQNVTSSTPVAGPGGGGSGGSIWLAAETVTMQPTGVLQTQGGQGGQGTSTPLEGVTVGGNGSAGYVRIDSAYDSNSGGSITGTTYQSVYHRYTDYSYDADNHLIDTVQGADNPIAAQAGKPSADGGQNVRTRTLYDPEGHVSERFDPRAFTASVTSPDLSFMVRTDYDYDERPATQWVPRYDNGAHADIGVINTQTTQCPTGADLSVYPSAIGLCVTRVAYDYNGNVTFERLPTSTSSGDNRYVIDSYTNDNLVSSVSAPNSASNGSQETVQSNVYDGDRKLVRQTDALGEQQLTAYTPDELVQSVTKQANGALTHVTSYTYDANGDQLTATDGSGNVTSTAYYSDNLRSDSTDGAGDHTSYQYDPNGNATTVTSPSANAGDPNNTAHAPTLNTYTFDNLLQSTTVPFAANDSTAYTTTYSYDDGGRKTSQHVALLNTANGSLASDGGTQSFSYYNDDRLVQQTGSDGSTITSQYDPAGNLASAMSGGSTISATYYLDGLPRTVDDGSQTTRFGYDGLGSVSARYQLADNGSNPIGTDYVYGDAELATQMAWGGAPSNSTFYAYDADGRPTTETMPNGEQLSWVFNPDNTLQQQTLSSAATGGTTLAQYTYAYNADYLITQQAFTGTGANGATPNQQTLCYGYDAANHVTNAVSEQTPGQACPATLPAPNVTWDHDGNRLSYTPTGGTTTNFTYNANDSILAAGGPAYAYTGAGETQNDGCLTYSYDGFGRLIQATLPGQPPQNCTGVAGGSYTYDALDRRAGQTDGASNVTTAIHYDGLNAAVAQESPGASGMVSYELDAQGTAAALTSNQAVQYLAGDGHGNISTATTSAASVACTARYDAFGAPLGTQVNTFGEVNPCNTGSTLDDILFKGARRDGNTGQYQFGSRVYDPAKATFLTSDEYRTGTPTANPSVGVDPLTANTYVGLNGDPVNLFDPTGHRFTTGCEDDASASCPSSGPVPQCARGGCGGDGSVGPGSGVSPLDASPRCGAACISWTPGTTSTAPPAFGSPSCVVVVEPAPPGSRGQNRYANCGPQTPRPSVDCSPTSELSYASSHDFGNWASCAVTNIAGAGVLLIPVLGEADAGAEAGGDILAGGSRILWAPENASMSDDALAYQSSAWGARSSIAGEPLAPALKYVTRDGASSMVRFDGFNGSQLIDRKLAVLLTDKAATQALNQSTALAQSGLTGVWEVPTDAQAARAVRLFDRLGITNISVEVVPYP